MEPRKLTKTEIALDLFYIITGTSILGLIFLANPFIFMLMLCGGLAIVLILIFVVLSVWELIRGVK